MKKYILAFVIAALFTACENDIPYRSSDVSPKLTMNGFINTESLNNIIFLSYTGVTEPGHIESATVDVYINDQFSETAEEVESTYLDKQKPYSIKSRFKPGDKVRIEARTTDDKHHVWVEEIVPQPIDILQVDTADIPIPASEIGYIRKKLRVKLRFKDRPDEKNYYRIAVERNSVKERPYDGEKKRNVNNYYNFWPWEDLVLTEGRPVTNYEELENDLFSRVENRYGVFDDSMFANSEYTMSIQTWFNERYDIRSGREKWDVSLTVRLMSITESEFFYLKTLNYLDSYLRDEFLDDPVRIPTNVKNGKGLVGFSSESSVTMDVILD